MLKRLAVILAVVSTVLLLTPRPLAAQTGEPYYLIERVNQIRAEYGLPPYQIDASLMAAAQAHSEWAAVEGVHSHTGAGGSTPTTRALAAGYGGGQSVRVGENIYYGWSGTPDSAIEWWRNSPIHFQTMTSPYFADIGAGVAYGPNGGFFTLNFGTVSGSPPPSSGVPPARTGPTPIPIEPVELAEPNEDGSVIHIVEYGQTLWDIAASYDVPLSEILALNRLGDDDLILPGDEIIIVPSPIQRQEIEEGPVIHTVATGQTLFEIALSYGVDLETVLALNGLTQNTIIHPGDELLIDPGPEGYVIVRPPVYHTVEEGQTPLEIALINGIDLETLYELNGLDEGAIIHPGDQLLIRPGDPTPTPPPPPSPTPSPTQPAESIALPSPRVTDAVESSAEGGHALIGDAMPGGIWVGLAAALGGVGLIGAVIITIRRRTVRRVDSSEGEEDE
jgi:LysM repeat protein